MKLRNSLFLIAILALASFFAFSPEKAQSEDNLGAIELASFQLDTLTNADTATLTFGKYILDDYKYSWQISATQLSGTTGGTAFLQQSNYTSGDYWTTVDTLALSGTSDGLMEGVCYGVRQRLQLITSGTQSTEYKVFATYKK